MTETYETLTQELQTKIQGEVAAFFDGARILKIDTASQMENANELANNVKKYSKGLEILRKGQVAPHNHELKQINGFYTGEEGVYPILKSILENINGKLIEFETEQEKIRQEIQRKRDEEARQERLRKEAIERKAREKAEAERKAAEEKEKAAREAAAAEERARLEAEQARARQRAAEEKAAQERETALLKAKSEKQKAKLETEMKEAREKAAVERAKLEEEARLAREAAAKEKAALEAEAAKAKADAEKAQIKAGQAQDEANEVVSNTVASFVPKTSGRSTRNNWTVEITDENKVVAWAIETKNLHFLKIDKSKISKRVKEMEGKINIPGTRIENKKITARRV